MNRTLRDTNPPAGIGYIRIASIFVSILAILSAVALAALLFHTASDSQIPFDNDEANHAIDGWKVYLSASQGSVRNLVDAVRSQGFYPPVHSFSVAISYWLLGPSLASSRLPSVMMFCVAVTLLAGITYRISSRIVWSSWLHPWLALTGAAFALLFALTSQTFVVLAILVMLEMTGGVAGLLLLLSTDLANTSDNTHRRRVWLGIAAGLAATVFFTKYSFGLFFIPGLIAGLITSDWPWKIKRSQLAETAMVVMIVAAIVGLWIAVTDRPTMLLFFTDHPEYAARFSEENLLYLPRVWLSGYSPTGIVGALVVGSALVGAIFQWHWLAVRVASWSVAVGLVVLTISTTNQPRHMLPLAPALWFLAGLGIVTALWRLRRYGGLVLASMILALAALLIVSAYRPIRDLPARFIAGFEGDPVYSEVQKFALDQADLGQPVLFIGDFTDQNGLLAVRWLAATSIGRSLEAIDLDYFPYETYEYSIMRTNRKPQIATVDPTFPRDYMNEVLARNYYATIVEIKHLENYYGPRAANPEDPLCGYPTLEREFENWIVILYDVGAGNAQNCSG